MLRMKSCQGLLGVALLLVLTGSAARPGVPGHGERTGRRLEPGGAARRDRHRPQSGNQRSCHRCHQQRRQLHHPVPPSRPLYADGRDERVPEIQPHRHAAGSQPGRRRQCPARRRRRDRERQRLGGSPAARNQQGGSRHRHRPGTASPNCRCSRAARWRSRRWSPASTTTRRRSTFVRSTTARSPTGR